MSRPTSGISTKDVIEAMNARLEEKVKAMNQAEGDAKIGAIAAVVNEWMAQRTKICEAMVAIADKTKNHTMRPSVCSHEEADKH